MDASKPAARHFTDKILPARRVHVVPSAPAASPYGPPHSTPCAAAAEETQITLVKDGETVRAIEIRCVCGEVIRLECEY